MIHAIIAAAAAAAAANSFNLNCSGTVETIVPRLLKDETKPYTANYRIDIDANLWCDGECKEQQPIASVTPLAIVLVDRTTQEVGKFETWHRAINRETGQEVSSVDSRSAGIQMSMFWQAQCEKAPFTGFPKVDTKF